MTLAQLWLALAVALLATGGALAQPERNSVTARPVSVDRRPKTSIAQPRSGAPIIAPIAREASASNFSWP